MAHAHHQHHADIQDATRITLVGMALDVALGVLKMLIGALFHSYALIADGIHSLSDALSDIMVIMVMRLSRQGPDDNHPYGHERFETFATVVMGSLLIAVAGALAWEGVQRLWQPVEALPGWPVLLVAVLSIVSKEWIFHYTRRWGERLRSDLIIANAWHSRTDALSSVIVLVAVAGAMLGWVWLDALAAVAIAVIVGKVGADLAWDSIKVLVDTALSNERSEEMRTLALSEEGVRNVHALRSRHMGQNVLIDIHLMVDPAISVSEGHQIGVRTVHRLKDAYPDIREIICHIDPEDDDTQDDRLNRDLPRRSEVIRLLTERWHPWIDFALVGPIRLHYLGEHVSVELYLHTAAPASSNLTQTLRQAAQDLPWLGQVRIWHAQEPD